MHSIICIRTTYDGQQRRRRRPRRLLWLLFLLLYFCFSSPFLYAFCLVLFGSLTTHWSDWLKKHMPRTHKHMQYILVRCILPAVHFIFTSTCICRFVTVFRFSKYFVWLSQLSVSSTFYSFSFHKMTLLLLLDQVLSIGIMHASRSICLSLCASYEDPQSVEWSW